VDAIAILVVAIIGRVGQTRLGIAVGDPTDHTVLSPTRQHLVVIDELGIVLGLMLGSGRTRPQPQQTQ